MRRRQFLHGAAGASVLAGARMGAAIAGVIGAGLAGLALGGCAARGPGDGVIRMAVANPARNLDPRLATDATSERVNRLLYRRLVEFDARGLPVPGIATWEQPAPTRYRFRLGREGRELPDGSRLAAGDVAATYRSILAADSLSPHRALLSIIRAVEPTGQDTVDFELEQPDPLFPAYLGIGILPAAGIEAGRVFSETPLGSGGFRLAAPLEPGRLALLRRRDGQRVELIRVADPSVRVMKLLRGEVQLLQNDLSPELTGYLAGREGIRVSTRPGANFSYLGFNLADPLTGRLALRRAIAHGIDRETLVRHLFQGRARAAEMIFPPEHWAGHPGLQAHGHDPELAARLVSELGARAGRAPGKPLRLVYKTSSDPFRVRLATAIQAQLAPIGIDLAVQSLDWGTFFGDVKAGRFQLYGLTWVGIRIPDIFRYAFHSSSVPPEGANRGRYHSPAADRLMDGARTEPDLDAQAALYRGLQERLHLDLPYVPLWYEDQILAARPEVRGYTLAADGNYDALEHTDLVHDDLEQALVESGHADAPA